MDTVNVAVIGCGVWGRNHVRVFSNMKGVTLEKISDISIKNASQIGERYNVDYCTNPQDIFDDPNIDAVTICTPTITHASLAEAAILSNKHVLVEKPMTNTVEEAKRLIKLSRLNKINLSVGFIERFNPAVQEAIRLVSLGVIGDVILAHTKRVSRWPVRIGDVGVIKDLAIHDVDIINQLFGVEADSIFTNAGQIQHTFEDYANIMMCYPNNKAAFIETNWLTPRKVRNLTVTGTNGIIHVDYITQTLTIENENQIVQPYIGNGEPLRLELESFIHSIVTKTEPWITGEDGLKALKVCENAIESARINKPVINQPTLWDN